MESGIDFEEILMLNFSIKYLVTFYSAFIFIHSSSNIVFISVMSKMAWGQTSNFVNYVHSQLIDVIRGKNFN